MLRSATQDSAQEHRWTGNSLRVHLRSSSPKAPRLLGLCPVQCLRGVPLVHWLPVHTCPEEHFLNTILLSVRPQFKHVKLILWLNDTCNLKAAPNHVEGKKKYLPCKIHSNMTFRTWRCSRSLHNFAIKMIASRNERYLFPLLI